MTVVMRVRKNLTLKNNSEARNLYSAIKRGDISGTSFMFCVDKQHIDDADSDYPTRHIDSIEEVLGGFSRDISGIRRDRN